MSLKNDYVVVKNVKMQFLLVFPRIRMDEVLEKKLFVSCEVGVAIAISY